MTSSSIGIGCFGCVRQQAAKLILSTLLLHLFQQSPRNSTRCLLQAYFFLWARSPLHPIGLASSVGGLAGASYPHPCLVEGTCHLADMGGEDEWLRGYWEQRFRFMREEMNLVEQRLQALNREFAAAKGQFQLDMLKTRGHRERDQTGADESVS